MHILSIVDRYIKQYNKLIDDEFGIRQDELLPLWNQIINNNQDEDPPPPPPQKNKQRVESSPAKSSPAKSSPAKSSPAKSSPAKSSPAKSSPAKSSPAKCTPVKSGCPYIFTKGAKEGMMCGCKPKGGNTYCSRHKKYEGQAPNVKKVLPPPRRSIVSNKSKATSKKKAKEIVLHKGPGGRLYHRPTGLVFNRDRVAIGTWLRACDNPEGVDEVVKLTEKDIAQAKKHMFAFKTEETDHVAEATRKVTRMLEPSEAKNLQDSLSHAINETNMKAEDVNDILCELQGRGSVSELPSEEISDESEYELEEELEEEE